MKTVKAAAAAALLALTVLFAGCSRVPGMPDNPVRFQTGEIPGFVTVEYNSRSYIMYGALKNGVDDVGECLGCLDSDEAVHIYRLKGASEDWLVEYYTEGFMEQPTVLRATDSEGVAVPDNVTSYEYAYWEGK